MDCSANSLSGDSSPSLPFGECEAKAFPSYVVNKCPHYEWFKKKTVLWSNLLTTEVLGEPPLGWAAAFGEQNVEWRGDDLKEKSSAVVLSTKWPSRQMGLCLSLALCINPTPQEASLNTHRNSWPTRCLVGCKAGNPLAQHRNAPCYPWGPVVQNDPSSLLSFLLVSNLHMWPLSGILGLLLVSKPPAQLGEAPTLSPIELYGHLSWCISYIILKIFLFVYLFVPGLSCGMWDLVPWPGIEPGSPVLET